ncbi:MAG: hypothetical protein ABI670_17900 [Chloroflexota bacterium]
MTAEGQLILSELRRLGLIARPLVWDDPAVDWTLPAVTVIRETCDYHHRRDEFVAWADRVSSQTTLLNSAEIVRWNTHKSYLRDLERKGVPIVPTEWLEAGTEADLLHIMSTNGWSTVVVKPAVSASAYETMLVATDKTAEGQSHIERLLPTRDLMVQPFLTSVRDYGERSLLFIDGELTHAVRRKPALGPTEEGNPWEATPVDPTPEEAEFATEALRASHFSTLYARVDIVRDPSNAIRLMELELIEPSLFLQFAHHATSRLAEGIMQLCRSQKGY